MNSMASAVAALQADVVEAPTPFAPIGEAANAGQVQAAARRAFSSSEAEWLSRLDGIQPTPSRRRVDFLDSCSDIDVSWSLNKVLLARMKVEGSTGRKDTFRSFAEKLAEGIPGAIAYETPKQWNVAKVGKKLLNVLELLDSSAAVRTALEILNAAMKTAAKTC